MEAIEESTVVTINLENKNHPRIGSIQEHFGDIEVNIALNIKELHSNLELKNLVIKGFLQKNYRFIKYNSC